MRPKLTHMPHLEARRKAEAEARLALRRDPIVESCSICGVIPAPYGYGVYSDQRPGARFACMDLTCRAQAKAQVCLKSETGRAA